MWYNYCGCHYIYCSRAVSERGGADSADYVCDIQFFQFLFYSLLLFIADLQKAFTENAIIESTKESTSDCRIARQLLWTEW